MCEGAYQCARRSLCGVVVGEGVGYGLCKAAQAFKKESSLRLGTHICTHPVLSGACSRKSNNRSVIDELVVTDTIRFGLKYSVAEKEFRPVIYSFFIGDELQISRISVLQNLVSLMFAEYLGLVSVFLWSPPGLVSCDLPCFL